jgi:hypothetical protein
LADVEERAMTPQRAHGCFHVAQELEIVDRSRREGMRTMARRLAMPMLIAVLLPLMLASKAEAAPHGCVSATSSYWISADVARRGLAVAANTGQPCSFYYSPGDTYSGSGAFIVKCSTGGKINHPDIDVQGMQNLPVVGEPIPKPCKSGATVTIHANRPFQGGAVVAGSPS